MFMYLMYFLRNKTLELELEQNVTLSVRQVNTSLLGQEMEYESMMAYGPLALIRQNIRICFHDAKTNFEVHIDLRQELRCNRVYWQTEYTQST